MQCFYKYIINIKTASKKLLAVSMFLVEQIVRFANYWYYFLLISMIHVDGRLYNSAEDSIGPMKNT